MAKIKPLTTPNTDKGVKQQELSVITGEDAKWYSKVSK